MKVLSIRGLSNIDVGLTEQFSIIEELNKSNNTRFSTKLLCEVFEVNRSSYRYWIKRDTTPCPEHIKLLVEVGKIHGDSNGSAGARTIAQIKTNNGLSLSRYRAGKMMIELDLVSCQLPKHQYKKGGHEHVEVPNILGRQFNVTEPNKVWCGDVTYSVPGVQH